MNTQTVRQYDGYVYLGDVDIKYGGTYYNVAGDVGHVVEVVEFDDQDDAGNTVLIQSRQVYVGDSLTQWRRALETTDVVTWDVDWRALPRDMRRAFLLDAMYRYNGGDPANEFPDYHEATADADDETAVYDAVEQYIR